jgi:hypothetical protein
MQSYVTPHSTPRALTSFDRALLQETVQACVEAVTENRRISHVTFNMIVDSTFSGELPYAWSTFPTGWVTRYLRQSYIAHDPVVRVGIGATTPFFWTDLYHEPGERQYLDDAARHGIGPRGYTIPHIEHGTRSLLSLTNRTLEEEDWRYYIEAIYPELLVFARCLHHRALGELDLDGIPLVGWKPDMPCPLGSQ